MFSRALLISNAFGYFSIPEAQQAIFCTVDSGQKRQCPGFSKSAAFSGRKVEDVGVVSGSFDILTLLELDLLSWNTNMAR